MDHIDHDLTAGPTAIPVTVFTGFPGAGKTTLLNRILNGARTMIVAKEQWFSAPAKDVEPDSEQL